MIFPQYLHLNSSASSVISKVPPQDAQESVIGCPDSNNLCLACTAVPPTFGSVECRS
jgi:hypothetical protein